MWTWNKSKAKRIWACMWLSSLLHQPSDTTNQENLWQLFLSFVYCPQGLLSAPVSGGVSSGRAGGRLPPKAVICHWTCFVYFLFSFQGTGPLTPPNNTRGEEFLRTKKIETQFLENKKSPGPKSWIRCCLHRHNNNGSLRSSKFTQGRIEFSS